MRDLNIDVASEYLHMAATLIRLKARELLPPQEGEVIDQEDGIYNREQLIQQHLSIRNSRRQPSRSKSMKPNISGAFGGGVRGY